MKKLLIIPFLAIALPLLADIANPYFSSPEMPNALHYLPGPPQTNEMRFAYDTAQYQWGKRMRPTARGEKAKADAEYDKFKERTKNELTPVEIHFLEQFEREQKKLGGKNDL